MRKVHFSKMRDRRNTNLSISSTDSTTSASSANTTRSGRNSLNEKRYSSPPLPSPTLPGPVTKENRPKPQLRRIMAAKGFVTLLVLLVLWRWIWGAWMLPCESWSLAEEHAVDTDTELVAASNLPDEPTAIMVQGSDGPSQWTISIPHDYEFPLPARYYTEMCSHGTGLRNTIASNSRRPSHKHWWRKSQYYAKDQTFIDIDEAEQNGLLPKTRDNETEDVCRTSMTFVLDSDDASFGKSLLQLWLSYGLAKKEGRAFFIDDSRWAWGNFTSYFQPPPEPECAPPPPHQRVPCPRSAKHLVVSSATAPWSLGTTFQTHFQRPRQHGLEAQSRVYDLLRTGYEALFKLSPDDAAYAAARAARLKSDAATNGGALIGMHIRRGDAHPLEYQYSKDYLPLHRYSEAAHALSRTQNPNSTFLLASDDPSILTSPELLSTTSTIPHAPVRAQDRIQLATKASLPPTPGLRVPGSAYIKHVDENTGWEGGFYPGLFFSLGEGVRGFVGRAYLLDLAVLAETDGVVCAVGSASCRVLGVAMGWERVREGRWVNVDGGRGWSWDGSRR